jgi:hypothetical protein
MSDPRNDASRDRYYILLVQKLARKKERGILRHGTSKVELLPGNLLICLDEKHSSDRILFVLETLDPENIEVECVPGEEIEEVRTKEIDLLKPIPTHGERLSVFQNKEWLSEGVRLTKDDSVWVSVKGQTSDLLGVIRYKGLLPGLKGIFFGVELVVRLLA